MALHKQTSGLLPTLCQVGKKILRSVSGFIRKIVYFSLKKEFRSRQTVLERYTLFCEIIQRSKCVLFVAPLFLGVLSVVRTNASLDTYIPAHRKRGEGY